MYSFFSIRNEASEPAAEVLIYDRIGPGRWYEPDGVSAKAFNKEIAKISADRDIKLRINSPGGSVYEGLAIYNYLKERKEHITCIVDGICGSIATIIACSGKKVIMNPGTGYFIHKVQGGAQGTSNDLRKAADNMDKVGEQLIDVYVEKTGLKREEISAMMEASTLMNEHEAFEKGFADELSDDGDLKASFDKEAFLSEFNSSPSFSNWLDYSKITTKKENTSMNDDNKLAAGTPTPQGNLENKIGLTPEEYQEYLENKAQIEKIRKAEAEQKRTEITNMVTALVNGGVYSNAVMQNLINGAVNNADNYALLKDSFENFKRNADAQNHVDPIVKTQSMVEPSMEDLLRHRNEYVLAEKHDKYNELLEENKDFLRQFLLRNEVTTSSPLKVDYIFKTKVLEDFVKVIIPLSDIFTTIFKNVPLEGTNKAQIPYYPNDTQEVKDFHYRGTNGGVNEGYQWDGSYNVGNKEIELDCHKYVDLKYTDKAIAEMPLIALERIFGKKAANLGYKSWRYFLEKITPTNYNQVFPTNNNGIALNKFTQDALVDLKTVCDKLEWPDAGRSLVMNADYGNNLLKGRVLQTSDATGTLILTKGTIKELTNFELTNCVNLPDSNKLVGFASVMDSLFIINQPIRPDAAIPMSYQVFTDPATGLSIELCKSGDPKYREVNISMDVHFGARVGRDKALIRITKP